MNKLTPHERIVLACMALDREMSWFFRGIANRTSLTERQAKRAARMLQRKGLVERSAVFDEHDGLLAGSGLCVTSAGITADF